MRKTTLLIVCLAAAAPLPGCIERRIRVTSEPSGARVWLNDRPIGVTPCEARFTYYGTYDVRLELDGHEPVHEGRTARAPIHEYPGIDLAATLAPVDFEHTAEWHYDLEPVAEGDEAREALRERAGAMRERALAPRD